MLVTDAFSTFISFFFVTTGWEVNTCGSQTATLFCRWSDHIGLALFYKRDKFSLMSEKSFIIHRKVGEFMRRVGVDNGITSGLQDHMKDGSTYTNIIDPPGCLLAKLRLKQDEQTTLCVATTHITWKELRYPVLQMLQVRVSVGQNIPAIHKLLIQAPWKYLSLHLHKQWEPTRYGHWSINMENNPFS